jgi:CRP-like cAMP-binding protein
MATEERLEQNRLFDGMSGAEYEVFLERAQKLSLKAGEYLFRENDMDDALYVVERGSVALKKLIVGNIERDLHVAREGSVFGELCFMSGGERSASAFAEEDTELLCLSRSDFDEVGRQHPEVANKILNNLLHIVVERLRNTNNAYRDAIQWGLEVTGTRKLNFQYLITEAADVQIQLVSDRVVEGKIIMLEKSDAGYEIILKDWKENLIMIPYHAVNTITVASRSI